MSIDPGNSLGRYRILSSIGSGGMGEVYLAEDTRLGRRVALKVLPESIAGNRDRRLRFEREAQAASALNHPNILTVHEFGEEAGVHFLASEFVKGKTLRDVLDQDGVPLLNALDITVQIASALQAAHDAGIVHRDIKPENVMVRDDGYVKVLDFGLAKISENARFNSKTSHPDDVTYIQLQTQAGIVMGTAGYMSPEQARGREIDGRTDIFSLGIVLYELLTREQPFRGETMNHTIVAILEKDPEPLSTFGIVVPNGLEDIVLHALAKDPHSRYQSAADLISDLKSLQRRIEFEAELERSTSPGNGSGGTTQILAANTAAYAEAANTIAIMPFRNLSRTEDGDYFSDGLAEELLNLLSKIKGLRVAARTSAFSFKGKQTTVAEIGRKLNVASVLEGSLRMAENRVRIAVQLINVADGYQLWSEVYDRPMDVIFEVQDDIARSVVRELRELLLGEEAGANASLNVTGEVALAARGRAANPEAQRLMFLGRYFLDRTTREDTAKAITYFREALDIDPGFALCWAELSRAFAIEAGRVWVPVSEGFDRARDAARRSLVLEPDLAEGHAQLGRVQLTYDWDLRDAERSYARALELAPGSSSVLDGAAVLAYKLGHLQEALDLYRSVLVQDPLSAAFWHNLGLAAHTAGLLAEAERAFHKALELVPQRFVSRALLSLVLLDQGRMDQALEQAAAEPYEMWRLWAQTIVFHAAGRSAESEEALRILIEEHAIGNAYQIAEIHSIRGDVDRAFDWLERAIDERDSGLTHLKVNPHFRALLDDKRWNEMLKKIGFEV